MIDEFLSLIEDIIRGIYAKKPPPRSGELIKNRYLCPNYVHMCTSYIEKI